MGARELADLLDRASAEVPPPAFAEAAWSRAFHIRRRRRSAVAAASIVAALVVTGGALHSLRPAPEIGATETATAALGPPTVDRIPSRLPGRTVRGLPAAGLTPPRDARMLSFRPVQRAVAVYQLHTVEEDTYPQPLYVLDTDGTWARIDAVEPTFTRDSGGNRADPLRPTAISPDRRLVAVAQPDLVLVIDVTRGGLHEIPLPGLNEQVVWLTDDAVLVTQDRPDGTGTATFTVDWRSKVATRVDNGPTAWDTVAQRPGGPVLELLGSAGVEPVVTEWPAGEPVRRVPVNSGALRNYEITEWYGPGFRNDGALVVRSAFGNTPTVGGVDMVAVVDVYTGVVRRLLDVGRDRAKGCCQPLDWVDEFTVLLRVDRGGLITWNVRTGEISLVGDDPVTATVAVALD